MIVMGQLIWIFANILWGQIYKGINLYGESLKYMGE